MKKDIMKAKWVCKNCGKEYGKGKDIFYLTGCKKCS